MVDADVVEVLADGAAHDAAVAREQPPHARDGLLRQDPGRREVRRVVHRLDFHHLVVGRERAHPARYRIVPPLVIRRGVRQQNHIDCGRRAVPSLCDSKRASATIRWLGYVQRGRTAAGGLGKTIASKGKGQCSERLAPTPDRRTRLVGSEAHRSYV